jgi:hypothetical protein
MAIRDDFFTALTNGAKWDVGVSINRTNPLPLDQYSVFKTETELDAYIGGAFAYPGQIIALVDENATTIYYLDQNKVKQPVGIIPEGDGKTIEVSATGAISLLGGVNAANGTLPMVGDDGKLTWKTLEDIGAGDGNDNTTYQFTLGEDGKSFSIKTLFNGQPIKGEDDVELDPQVITFDVYTKSEVDAKIGTASVPESTEGADDGKAATGVYVAIEAEAARAAAAEKALDDAIKAIDFMDAEEVADAIEEGIKDLATKKYVNDELAKKVDSETYAIDKKALEDEDKAIREVIKGVSDRVDAFLTGEGTAEALDSLQELIAYIDSHDDVDIAGILEDIQAIENKLAGIDSTVVAYVTAAIDALKIGDYAKAADLTELAERVTALEGKVDVEKVSTAIATAKQEAIDDAKKYAEATTVYTKTETDNLLKDKANSADVTTELNKKVDKVEGYGLLSSTDQEKLNKLTLDDGNLSISGSVEAGSVKNLDSWITTNRDTVAGLYPAADATKLAGVAAGAQVNILEGVQVNSADLVITADKKVNIDLSAYALGTTVDGVKTIAEQGVADATKAQTTANEASAKALANEGAITGLDTRLTAVEGVGNKNAGDIAGHETRLSTAEATIKAINETSLPAKADKSVVDGLSTTVGTHTQEIAALSTNKADASAVYGKSEVYNKTEIDAITGAVPTNSSIMAEIAKAQTAATYNDTEVRTLIGNNATAIENIIKTETGAIAVAKAEALKAVSDLGSGAVATNAANIKKNTDAIDILNGDNKTEGSVDYKIVQEVAKILNDNDANDIDTLEEIAAWIKNDTAGVADLNRRITANETAIGLINNETSGILAQAKADTAAQIAALKLADTYEVKGAAATALGEAKDYTDTALTAYKVKDVDGTSLKVSEAGVASVNQVSTDMLVQGTQTLVLNGGSATVPATAE